MTPLLIRRAEPDDFAAVATLLAELGRPAPGPATRATMAAVYRRHLARTDTHSLVAEVDGEVIGFLSLEFRERLNRTTPQAWVPDLIVSAAHRRRGAGRALLQAGFELARQRGCWSVTLESGYSRAEAHQLYKSAGMADQGLFFVLQLGGEGTTLE